MKKKLIGVVTASTFVLTGCSTDNPDDGLVGDSLSPPLLEVQEALEAGDGSALCSHMRFAFRNPCEEAPLFSSGLDEAKPEIFDTPSGQVFDFSVDDFSLVIERADFEIEGEENFSWSVRDLAFPEIDFPSGGSYAGTNIESKDSVLFMPGELDPSQISIEDDKGGYWTSSLDLGSSQVSYELAPDALVSAQEEMERFCRTYTENLTALMLLEDARDGIFWKKDGQEPDAQEITFVYEQQNQLDERTINFPRLESANCTVDQASLRVGESTATFSPIIGKALIDLEIKGEVARLSFRDRARGARDYEWIEKSFDGKVEMDLSLRSSVEGVEVLNVTNSAVGEVPLQLASQWSTDGNPLEDFEED